MNYLNTTIDKLMKRIFFIFIFIATVLSATAQTQQGYAKAIDRSNQKEQYQEEKHRIENSISTAMERRYKSEIERLEQQKAANQLSLEQYHQQLQQLQQNFERIQGLVEGLAEHYALMDYDELNDKEREINLAIEAGQLERADSLLQLLGVQKQAQDIAQRLQNGQQLQTEAQQDMTQILKQQKKDANHLYQLYTIALSRFDHDKALFYIETRAALDTTNVNWQNSAGKFLFNYKADYTNAMVYFQRMLRQSLLQYGEESKWTAIAYDNIGNVNQEQGNYTTALDHYNKALNIRLKVYGAEHNQTASSYYSIAQIYQLQHNYIKAMEYEYKALNIWEKKYGTEHPKMALFYVGIGNIYFQLENHTESLIYQLKAVDIYKKKYGTEYPGLATPYANIGMTYTKQGEYDKALEYLNNALNIRIKVLGPEHPRVANSYNSIGLLYIKQNDFTNALKYFNDALKIKEKVYGTEHPDIANTYSNIGLVYRKQKNYAKALKYYKKSLSIREKLLGEDHPDTKRVEETVDRIQHILERDARSNTSNKGKGGRYR